MNETFGLAPIKAEGTATPFDKDGPQWSDPPSPPPEIKILAVRKDSWYVAPDPTTKYVCQCGSDKFTVHYRDGGYETSVRCTSCDEAYTVHEG